MFAQSLYAGNGCKGIGLPSFNGASYVKLRCADAGAKCERPGAKHSVVLSFLEDFPRYHQRLLRCKPAWLQAPCAVRPSTTSGVEKTIAHSCSECFWSRETEACCLFRARVTTAGFMFPAAWPHIELLRICNVSWRCRCAALCKEARRTKQPKQDAYSGSSPACCAIWLSRLFQFPFSH